MGGHRSEFAAVVLAGGAATRLGGTPKPARTVAGTPLLRRVLDAVAGADPRIVVGPPAALPPLPSGVLCTVESPPGGGPVAGTAAGLALLPRAGVVAVLAADLPFLTAGAVDALRRAAAGHDGAVLLDGDGRPQWLCGVWAVDALTRRLAELGDPAGAGMRLLVAGLDAAEVTAGSGVDAAGPPVWFDCDTEEDLRRAEEWADGGSR